MPEAFFQVWSSRREDIARERLPDRALHGFATHYFHETPGVARFAPLYAGTTPLSAQTEKFQWPIKCSSTRRTRRKPGWSCYAAIGLRNSTSKLRTASSCAETSISPR